MFVNSVRGFQILIGIPYIVLLGGSIILGLEFMRIWRKTVQYAIQSESKAIGIIQLECCLIGYVTGYSPILGILRLINLLGLSLIVTVLVE